MNPTIKKFDFMKNIQKILPLAVVAALGGVVAACNNTGDGATKLQLATYLYDTLVYDHTADSIDLPGSQYWKMKGRGVLPVKIGGISVPTLRDSLMTLANVTFNAGDAVPVVDSTNRILPYRDVPDSLKDVSVSDNSNYLSIYLITPFVAVWENYSEGYISGAAHGFYSTTYVNYSIKDRKILKVSDMFKTGYEKHLIKMLKEKLDENKEVNADDSIKIPDNFCITTTGMTFVYGLYEIAPYSAGEIRVDFRPYELSEILSPLGAGLLEEE